MAFLPHLALPQLSDRLSQLISGYSDVPGAVRCHGCISWSTQWKCVFTCYRCSTLSTRFFTRGLLNDSEFIATAAFSCPCTLICNCLVLASTRLHLEHSWNGFVQRIRVSPFDAN